MFSSSPLLENNFEKWLKNYASRLGIDYLQLAYHLGFSEAENRKIFYPQIQIALAKNPIDYDKFIIAANNSWSLSERFFQMKFTLFVKKKKEASGLLQELISDFPKDNDSIKDRIDKFIDGAVRIAFTNKNGIKDYSGAALLASVVLSAMFQTQFIDYRYKRWQKFSSDLDVKLTKPKSYGEQIIEASNFAIELSNSIAFNNIWNEKGNLWVLSGICWDSLNDKRKILPEEKDEEFPEGKQKEKLHKYYERNPSLVRKAKEFYLNRDGKLSCEVCGFNFSDTYGKRGEHFIEAHHRIEISKLKENHKSKIQDLAMVCSNCHRIIHRGKKSLSIDEMKNIVTILRTKD